MKFGVREFIDTMFIPLFSCAVFVLWEMNKTLSNLTVQTAVLIQQNEHKQELDQRRDRRLDQLEALVNGLRRR